MKVIIRKIYRGQQLVRGENKPKIAIKTDVHGESWVSSLNVPGTESWKEGQEVEIDITPKVTDKGTYYNFNLPGQGSKTGALEARVKKLEDAVFGGAKLETDNDFNIVQE